MISLTRLNGQRFALNPDLIERLDVTPDTVVTLIDGAKYLVSESLDEVIVEIRRYRASVVALANAGDIPVEVTAITDPVPPPVPRVLRIVGEGDL